VRGKDKNENITGRLENSRTKRTVGPGGKKRRKKERDGGGEEGEGKGRGGNETRNHQKSATSENRVRLRREWPVRERNIGPDQRGAKGKGGRGLYVLRKGKRRRRRKDGRGLNRVLRDRAGKKDIWRECDEGTAANERRVVRGEGAQGRQKS